MSTTSLAKKAKAVTRETSTTTNTNQDETSPCEGSVEDAMEKGLCKDAGEPCKSKAQKEVAAQKMGDEAVVDKVSEQKPSAVQSEPEQDGVSREASSVTLNAGPVSERSTASVAAE